MRWLLVLFPLVAACDSGAATADASGACLEAGGACYDPSFDCNVGPSTGCPKSYTCCLTHVVTTSDAAVSDADVDARTD